MVFSMDAKLYDENQKRLRVALTEGPKRFLLILMQIDLLRNYSRDNKTETGHWKCSIQNLSQARRKGSTLGEAQCGILKQDSVFIGTVQLVALSRVGEWTGVAGSEILQRSTYFTPVFLCNQSFPSISFWISVSSLNSKTHANSAF